MSIRTLLRIWLLSVTCLAASLLLWSAAVPLFLSLAACGLLLPVVYLTLIAGQPPATRWQLRYDGSPDGLLHDILAFMAGRAGHAVVEANGEGLFLEAPRALDRYVAWQLPRALPGLKLVARDEQRPMTGSCWLCLGAPGAEPLRWATEAAGRQVRLHLHAGPYATLIARTNGEVPPGRWLKIPMPRLVSRVWQYLPVWDELSAGTSLAALLPAAGPESVFSSRPRVMHLVPPDGYQISLGDRLLGLAADGRPVGVDRAVPLFTVGAPPSFLARQVMDDLELGPAIAVSSQRRVLELIHRQAAPAVPCYWLDVENTPASAHLAIVTADEWAGTDLDAILHATDTLLASLGVDLRIPAFQAFTHSLVRCLAVSARVTGRDLSLEDLYDVCQGTRDLRVFLFGLQGLDLDAETREVAAELEHQLGDDGGYVHTVAGLGVLREALRPLGDAALRSLCQPPFLPIPASPGARWLLLAPIPTELRPDHRRFLGALLDLALTRARETGNEGSRLALHAHDPQLYWGDAGQKWIGAANDNRRLTVLVDTQDPAGCEPDFPSGTESSLFSRCSGHAAARLIAIHDLPCATSDLTELPDGVAIASLPALVAAVKIGEAQ